MSSPSLDYNKHNRNKYCGEMCVTGPVISNGRYVNGYARLFCKAWDCPECGPKKAFLLQKAMAECAVSENLNVFITLTLDPKKLPVPCDTVEYIRKSFCSLRVYLGREFGHAIKYISLLEFQKNGNAHLHILTNQFIPQAWLSDKWDSLGGGKIVWVERVSDLRRISYYLSKYLTKDTILSAPRGTRRYTTSRGIRLLRPYAPPEGQFELNFGTKFREKSKWELGKRSIEEYYFRAGLDVVSTSYHQDGSIRFFTTNLNLDDGF